MALPALRQPVPPSAVCMMEQHFSLKELAEMWKVSEDFVYSRFRGVAGILYGRKRNSGKAGKGLIRVPKSVAERVYAEMVSC